MICIFCSCTFNSHECGIPESNRCRECYLSRLKDIKCSGSRKKLCEDIDCKKCFEKSFASNIKSKYWDYELNKDWPIEKLKSSGKRWFLCECGHKFEKCLSKITHRNGWCPYCANQKLCNDECKTCSEKSFSNHPKAKYWSTRNNVTPRDVFKGSSKRAMFDCECDHTFECLISNISCNEHWCPYCSQPPKLLCSDVDCKTCFEKSFASHKKSIYWSKENDCIPRQAFKYTNKKYKFDCECGHIFECQISSISCGEQWCGYCSKPPQLLCSDIDCKTCFEKSFASHEKAKNWSKENKKSAREVFLNCISKFKFMCDKNHIFEKCPDAICSKNGWCPKCVNKTEQMVIDYLDSQKIIYTYQPKFSWCVKKNQLPFDIQIGNWLIEIDGDQHFEDTKRWNTSYKVIASNDVFKMKCAIDNGFSVIRISQVDIYNNKIDWKSIINFDKCDATPQILYFSVNPNLYNYHKSKFAALIPIPDDPD